MKKRIYISMCLLALGTVLLTSSLLLWIFYGFFTSQTKGAVRDNTEAIAQGMNNTQDKKDYLKALSFLGERKRLTWISSEGEVLYDSYSKAEGTLESHLTRPEVIEAFDSGSGEETRYSTTLGEKTFYHALLLKDGSVLRLSHTLKSIQSIFIGILPLMFFVTIAVFVLCLFIAFRITKKIITPLESLNIDDLENSNGYDELSPFLRRISYQNRKIKEQMEQLAVQRDRINVITENMTEGLLLIDSRGRVLSANKSFLNILHCEPRDYSQRSFLELTRSNVIVEELKSALAGVNKSQTLALGDREFYCLASPVYEEGTVGGAILLLLDITERQRAEKVRREFSANVSHELKTPLTSISGYAELIASGMAKGEDAASFASKIRSEATRLLELINNIIKLSRLDETSFKKDFERLNLLKMATSVVERLEDMAREKEVELKVSGDSAVLKGNRAMLEDLIFNLCENAIKYNKPKGRVDINILKNPQEAVLEIRDTGIGIPKKHQQRIFERFYRVDKSHSKKTGGNGLGLAIVKHIAEYHEGIVEVESKEQQGTTMRVRFKV